jgi:hypothetical protein
LILGYKYADWIGSNSELSWTWWNFGFCKGRNFLTYVHGRTYTMYLVMFSTIISYVSSNAIV